MFFLPLYAGAAYVFVLSGGVGSAWTQAQKLLASDGVDGDEFGISVALSGELLVVGAHWDDNEKGIDAGGLYSFYLYSCYLNLLCNYICVIFSFVVNYYLLTYVLTYYLSALTSNLFSLNQDPHTCSI
jgi:hypothetical protein